MRRFIQALFDYFERHESVPYHQYEDMVKEKNAMLGNLNDRLTRQVDKVDKLEKECFGKDRQIESLKAANQKQAARLDKIQNVLDFGCSCDDPTECEQKGECTKQ